jgi:hypothetical protein
LVQSKTTRVVRQFQYLEWPPCAEAGGAQSMDLGQVMRAAERFVDFVQQVHQTKAQFGYTAPICVHDTDGAGILFF